MTTTDIRCPKCHASAAALELRTEYLACGSVIQVVRCVLCSERRQRIIRAAVTPRKPAAIRKPVPIEPSRSQPCPIPGCTNNFYSVGTNPFGLCKLHRNTLAQWEQSKKTLPVPFAQVNGVWIKRSEPLPGIPAEVAAPMTGGKKVTRRSKWYARCGGCKTMQNIVAWGLCLECLEADRLKQKGARHA